VIVGTILNLINRGDAILGRRVIRQARLLLTYLSPYAVGTHGAVSTSSRMEV